MTKTQIDPGQAPFPKPIVLVGSLVNGRPNFFTVAWISRINFKPNLWAISMGRKKYTLEGIRHNQTFSVNIPGAGLVEKTDYCGIYSGRKVDKSTLFNVFYGELETAPMIQECPICIECTLYGIIELPNIMQVIGEVKHIYSEEKYLTDGAIDHRKVNPFVFTRPDDNYWTLGETIGRAWEVGKELKN
ncbi:MAG: flavin reductase family protein [Candidatus Hodarchaeota archaeon]